MELQPRSCCTIPGYSSRADLRVSGPWSTSSCSLALVMWLPHGSTRSCARRNPGAATSSAGSREIPPGCTRNSRAWVLLLPVLYAAVPWGSGSTGTSAGVSGSCHRSLSLTASVPALPRSHCPAPSRSWSQGGQGQGRLQQMLRPQCHRLWLQGQPGSRISSHCPGPRGDGGTSGIARDTLGAAQDTGLQGGLWVWN